MSLVKIIISSFLSIIFLSGCIGVPVSNDRQWHYGVSPASVDSAEAVRSKVLNSKPSNGVWKKRTFENHVYTGSDDDRGGYSSFSLKGDAEGVIPNEAPDKAPISIKKVR